MDLNDTETANASSNKTRSVFYCPQAADFINFPWMFAVIGAIASPTTILLNALVIIAVKQRKELQRLSNILTSSMAVADLLAGGICLPLTVTLGLLVTHQGLADEHICMLDFVIFYFTYAFYLCSLFHLTIIAWERYVAIRKWMDYKVIVTRSRLKKLAIIAWISALLGALPDPLLTVLEGKNKVLVTVIETLLVVTAVFEVCCLALILYLYVMVYLGVRKRKLSQISQVSVLVQAKLENRIAMTFALVAAALILSFAPDVVTTLLGIVFPVLDNISAMWVAGILQHFNSTFNPLIYWYRDRRFRKAVLELLRIKKPLANHIGAVGALPAPSLAKDSRSRDGSQLQQPSTIVMTKALIRGSLEDVAELRDAEKAIRLTRSASCDVARDLDRAHLDTQKTAFTRTMSAPSLSLVHSCSNHQPL